MDRPFVNPREFATVIRNRWRNAVSSAVETASVAEPPTSALPPELDLLEAVIGACLKASLERDEQREVTFRLILCPPEAFDSDHEAHMLLLFDAPRAFSATELRKLAPAADFYRTVIGAYHDPAGVLRIWGLIHSGPEWIQAITGGRGSFRPLPHWPVISVLGPGSLAAARGSYTLALLRSGSLLRPSVEVFESYWLPAAFQSTREEVQKLLAERVAARGGARNTLHPDLVRQLGQHAVRRMISLTRRMRHGGALVFLPAPEDGLVAPVDQLLQIKYCFPDHPRRLMFRWTMLDLLEFLSCDLEPFGVPPGRSAEPEPSGVPPGRSAQPEPFGVPPGRSAEPRQSAPPIDWEAYKASNDHRLKRLDDRLFEFAHIVSEVSQVDGAVVLNRRFELLGFGGEILANHVLGNVYRAWDAEGSELTLQSVDEFGTRHRSAFRLCAVEPRAIVVVVSQDGSISFIKSLEGKLVFWDQVAVSVLDI